MYGDINKDYHKPLRIGNAFSYNCIKYESNEDKNNILSIEYYFDEIGPYSKNLIDTHKTQGERKV